MNPKDYEGKVLNIEGVDQEVPMYSEWERKCSCMGCNVSYFPEIKSYFFNQWELNCTFPIIVIILFLLSFICGLMSIFEALKDNKWKLHILIGFCVSFLFWAISYFTAMFRSPGYLPFYWAVEKRHEYTYEEQMDGIITRNEQFAFANCNERPERGSLSRQARRLVLKADHICTWLSNWIGLKNYRFFFLQLVWTFAVFVFWFIIVYFQVNSYLKTKKFTTTTITMMVLILPDIGFFFFFMKVFINHIRYVIHNDTTLYEFKRNTMTDDHNYYDVGCCNNIEQTMGPCYCCPLYLFPVPLPRLTDGFTWKTNRTLPETTTVYPPITPEIVMKAMTKAEYIRKQNLNNLATETIESPPPSNPHKKKHKRPKQSEEEVAQDPQ